MSKREPLLRSHIGKETCSTWRDRKLCVRGGKYGFIAELIGTSGGKLPVPTGDARTSREAITNAKAFLDRVATKRN